MQIFWPVFWLVALGSLAGLIGGIVVIFNKRLSNIISSHAIPLAAGVLLSAAFLDVLPEAFKKTEATTILSVVLFSFLGSFFVENFLFSLHHHEGQENIQSTIPLVIAGDTIHNAMDGITIAASFLVDPKLGFLIAVAIFLHEVPHEIGDFGIMLSAGWGRAGTLLVNFFSALASFFGAFLVLIFSNNLSGHLGIILAIAAGMFIYLSASDFLPKVSRDLRKNPVSQTVWLFGGAILMFIIGILTPV